MALRTDGSQRLVASSALLNYNADYAITGRLIVRGMQVGNGGGYILVLYGDNDNIDTWYYDANTSRFVLERQNGAGNYTSGSGSLAIAVDVEYDFLLESVGSVLSLYINGTLDVQITRSTAGRLAITQMSLSDWPFTIAFSGVIALEGLKMFGAAIGVDLASAEYAVQSPRGGALVGWWPCQVHTDLGDLSGVGATWSVTGTLTTETPFAFSWGDVPQAVGVAASGGTTGTGALAAAGETVAGTGTTTVSGSGALAGAGASLAGAGTATVMGAATVAAAGETLGGTGTPTVSGSGALASDGDTLSGAGAPIVSGTGALAADGETLSGTGSAGAAAGALASAGQTLSGTGTVTVTGTGALAAASQTVGGLGTLSVIGTGMLAAAGQTLAGTGTVGAVATTARGARTLARVTQSRTQAVVTPAGTLARVTDSTTRAVLTA